MDMVSQVDQPGAAMEVIQSFIFKFISQNWGLMIFDTDALLINPDSTNEDDR